MKQDKSGNSGVKKGFVKPLISLDDQEDFSSHNDRPEEESKGKLQPLSLSDVEVDENVQLKLNTGQKKSNSFLQIQVEEDEPQLETREPPSRLN